MTAASLACHLVSVPADRRSGRRNGTLRAMALSETLPYNRATGGAVTEFVDSTTKKKYRVHTFTSDSSFVPSLSTRRFRVLIAGGGGGGGGNAGGGGGAGANSNYSITYEPGSTQAGATPRANSGNGGAGGATNGADGVVIAAYEIAS